MTEGARRVGRYEVELTLGEGPVSRTFVANDPVLGRRVALKLLREDLPLSEAVRGRLAERVRAQARTAAALSHPGLAVLHDMGEADSAGPFVVFEFIKGPTLRERLGAGPLAPAEVSAIGRAIGAALAHGHSAGVTYGDLRAENILLTGVPDIAAKLTEPAFTWLAWSDRELRDASPAWADTTAPANPAPELLASGTPSAFSDQFSFAAMLYEALTGQRPFGTGAGERAQRMAEGSRKPLSVARPNLRSFPHLDAIFDRALARDPRKRFSSCDVFGSVLATELEGIASGRVSSPSVSSIVPRATRRWQNALAGVAVLVILSLVMLGRQRPSGGEGASLTRVASAFSATIGPPHASATSHVRPPRAAPSSASARASASAAFPPEIGTPPVADGAVDPSGVVPSVDP